MELMIDFVVFLKKTGEIQKSKNGENKKYRERENVGSADKPMESSSILLLLPSSKMTRNKNSKI